MDRTFTFLGEIEEIVRRETRYLRTYWGEVVDRDDPSAKGRIKAIVPVLGWDSDATAAWCMPRTIHSMVVPYLGEHVEVSFLEGDRDKPVYRGQTPEITGETPEGYSSPDTIVVFQDPEGAFQIIHDRETEVTQVEDSHGNTVVMDSDGVKLDGNEIHLRGTGKTFVTHAELDAALQIFITALNLHVHATVTSLGVPTPPASPMSLDISGSNASTIKTG